MKKYGQLCLVVIALFCFGCKAGRSVVGKWTTIQGQQTQAVEFTSDSKVSAKVDVKQPLPMTVVLSGTYAIDKDHFSLKATDLSVKTVDASKQPLLDKFMTTAAKQQQIDMINKKSTDNKLTWVSDDEFTITDSAGTQQKFTRVKS